MKKIIVWTPSFVSVDYGFDDVAIEFSGSQKKLMVVLKVRLIIPPSMGEIRV